jgi:plastocyanin
VIVTILKCGLLLLAASLSACETSGSAVPESGAAGSARSRAHTVFIRGFSSLPQDLTVEAGDTVVFKNLDMVQHSAIGSDWSTGDLATDSSERVVMDRVGEHRYHCGPHPSMVGRVVVR